MNVWLRLFCVIVLAPYLSLSFFIKLPNAEIQKPLELMVDITNKLANKILYSHSLLTDSSHDNYAFSPIALGNTLIALLEGSSGKSAAQIQQLMDLPSSSDVIRIGYRDIHRRLKTYFFYNESPLAGLVLSEKVFQVTPAYEKILDFYGFQLSVNEFSAKDNGSVVNETSAVDSLLDNSTRIDFENNSTTQKSVSSITSSTQSLEKEEDASTTTTTSTSTTTMPTSTVSPFEGNFNLTTTTSRTKPYFYNNKPIISGIKNSTNSTEEISTPSYPQNILDPKLIFPSRRTLRPIIPIQKNQTRIKRYFLFQEGQRKEEEQEEEEEEEVIFRSGIIENEEQNRQILNTNTFYLNPFETVEISFKFYSSILNYGFISEIKSTAIEFELDSKDYNLLLLIPDYRADLNFVLKSLALSSSVNKIRKSLRPKWIQVAIPNFHLEGTVYLTKNLQNLGLSDIFEPSKADLHPMMDKKRMYVKHIKQSINVHIRTRSVDKIKRNSLSSSSIQPLLVYADHPFLFFIIDNEIGVATICGVIANPLNVRIQ